MRSVTRWGILSLVVATTSFVVQPLATGRHMATTEHHWCAEHETLEHNCEGECDTTSVPEPSVAQVTPFETPKEAEHSHAICHQTLLVSDTFVSRTSTGVYFPVTSALDDCDRDEGSIPALPRLTLAPKTSPPALS